MVLLPYGMNEWVDLNGIKAGSTRYQPGWPPGLTGVDHAEENAHAIASPPHVDRETRQRGCEVRG
jgi:hypothetical protein